MFSSVFRLTIKYSDGVVVKVRTNCNGWNGGQRRKFLRHRSEMTCFSLFLRAVVIGIVTNINTTPGIYNNYALICKRSHSHHHIFSTTASRRGAGFSRPSTSNAHAVPIIRAVTSLTFHHSHCHTQSTSCRHDSNCQFHPAATLCGWV